MRFDECLGENGAVLNAYAILKRHICANDNVWTDHTAAADVCRLVN